MTRELGFIGYIGRKKMPREQKPCGCEGPEKCRKCAMLEAHKCRINGDEEKFESWLAVACGLMNNERLRK